MNSPQEKLTRSVSKQELERRWKLVREKMREEQIDYLVMQNSEGFLGGTVRWFIDFTSRHQMPLTVIFPVEGEMTTIACGLEPPAETNWPPSWAIHGIGRRLGHCYFPTIPYTATYDAELAVGVLKEKDKPKIGLVESSFIPMTFFEHLKKELPSAIFVDSTDLVDNIKAIKSPEEIGFIKESAALCDGAIEELKKIIRPGIRDKDVRAELHCYLAKNGCERGLVQVGSGPQGTAVGFDVPRFQNKIIRENDVVHVLVEISGPGHYWTEILRPFVVGRRPIPELQERFEIGVEVQELVAHNMVPGVKAAELWRIHEQALIEKGMIPKRRSFAHAQGLSYMERPNLHPDETWTMKPGMNIAVHPYVIADSGADSIVFDNYLVEDNASVRLHKTPKEIIVI